MNSGAQCPQPHQGLYKNPTLRISFHRQYPLYNNIYSERLEVHVAMQFSQLQDEFLGLIVKNLSLAASGDKGLFQGIYRNVQVSYVVLDLSIQISVLIPFFFHFIQGH